MRSSRVQEMGEATAEDAIPPTPPPAPPYPAATLPPPLPTRATLYIGDLDPAVNEADLIHAFAGLGPIASARVCRDHASGASRRYAYLNFLSSAAAETALKTMNHSLLKGKPMRIMWSQRDALARRNGVGNLFVKNLEKSVGGAELEGLFAEYGKVESCKVEMDVNGRSKGFGFVQMESEAAAQSAIGALNGVVLPGSSKRLYVSKLVKKNERQALAQLSTSTNLYIKNLDCDITDDVLREWFSEYGTISSAVVMKDKDGRSRGFGFVNYKSPENAKKALEAMNGSKVGSKTVYIGRAQTKAEREETLRLVFAERHDQSLDMIQGVTVYVENLDKSVDERKLRDCFVGCGKIIWTRVVHDMNGLSRGFGFVCFSSSEEAKKAVEMFNGTVYHGKCLYVAIAPNMEDFCKASQLQFTDSKAVPVQYALPCGSPSP